MRVQRETIVRHIRDNEAKFQSLNRSYVKILSDMKIDYFVQVSRASWCESDGCGDGDTYKFPATKVDADTFEYFDSLTVEKIVEDNWRGVKYNIPHKRWVTLRHHPEKNMRSSHNYLL